MFEIQFIGTSSASPSPDRGLTCQAVYIDDQIFLVDCGEGTTRQLRIAEFPVKRINAVFLTHSHADHVWGVAGLLWALEKFGVPELKIYGSTKTLGFVKKVVVDSGVFNPHVMNIDLHLIPLPPIGSPIINTENLRVSWFPVVHADGSVGYIFERPEHRRFRDDVADYLGVPPTLRDKLKKGETVVTPDGDTITPDMIFGDTVSPLKLVITGDVDAVCLKDIVKYCSDADVLVTEATYLPSETHMVVGKHHITMDMAARLGAEANAKKVFLTHINPRNKEERGLFTIAVTDLEFIHPNIEIASDFQRYSLEQTSEDHNTAAVY